MKIAPINSIRLLVLLATGLLAGTGALADEPYWLEGGKNAKHDNYQQNKRQVRREESSQHRLDRGDRHFGDEQRTVITHYYSEHYKVGRCPPGLAKKHNGCMPPGQARQWVVGRTLPREVVYYDLPPSIVVQLGVPRAGQRYVRVASDILLIAIGTGMVLDGIEDLGR